jgi:hypothetical protein
MPKSRTKSKRRRKRQPEGRGARASDASLARTLAPEELRAGDHVAVLQEIVEWPSWFWDCDAVTLPPQEPVRVARTPEQAGVPLVIEAVCLPFVLAKAPCGSARTLDVRRCRLARLDQKYASVASCAFKKASRAAKRASARA